MSMERIQYLVSRYLDGLLTQEEEAEFNQLFEGGTEYREAEWEPLFERIMAKADVTVAQRRGRIRRMRWMAAAAVLLLVAGTGWFLERSHQGHQPAALPAVAVAYDAAPGSSKAILTLADGKTVALDSLHHGVIGQQGVSALVSQNEQLVYQKNGKGVDEGGYNVLTTPRGGQYCVVLPDGTKVWLNADSYLRYPTEFKGNSREVELRGEGYFEVAANAAAPFRVHALRVKREPLQIDVLGTHFNIMDYDDEPTVRTTLLEGSVRVSKGAASALLKPGQQAWLEGEDRLVTSAGNVEEAVAWKNGLFKFDGATMGQVMRQLSRWYDLDVEYVNGVPKDLFQGEMYRDVKVSGILKLLEASGVHFTVEGKRLLVK